MPEFEELKVSVSFADNASDKLKDVNAQLGKLGTGGDVNKKAVEGFKVSADFVSKLATEVRGVASAFNLFGGLPIFKLGAGTGFAGIVLAIKQTNDALGAFAKEILALRDLSRSAGLLPDQFKNVTNQLKLVGYTSDQASQEVLSFVRTIDEASRPGTSQFMRIYELSATPELAMSRINQMRDLIRSGQPGQAIMLAAREARAIQERELNRPGGGGMQEARRQAEAWLSSIGLSMRALGITDISDFLGDPQKWQRRIEAAERFNVEYEKFNKILGGIITDFKMELLPLFEDLNKALTAGAFDTLLAKLKTDTEDIRKIIAIAEGDWEKLASLLPKGPARRAALMLAEQKRLSEETEGEKKAPTVSGRVNQFRQRQRGYRDWMDKQLKDNEEGYGLLEEFKRLNSVLFGLQAAKDAAKANPAFHNAPQGGAEGESNPMQLPAGIAQPGGGAAAEARAGKPLSIQQQAQQTLAETRSSQGTPAPGTPLPQRRPPSASITTETAGPLAALGASYVGNRTYAFDDPRITNEIAKQTIEESGKSSFGFSYPRLAQPEAYYQAGSGQEVTTMAHEYEHVGRAAVKTGALIGKSLESNVFKRYGAYVEPSFAEAGGPKEERQQRYQEMITSRQLHETGVISLGERTESFNEAQSYLRSMGGTPRGEFDEATRHSVAQERYAQLMLASPFWSRASGDIDGEKGAEARPTALDLPLPGGLRPEDEPRGELIGESTNKVDRTRFDGGLAADAGIDASADLDVNVRGPAGVDVKASGDGMFKGNTSVSRQVDLE